MTEAPWRVLFTATASAQVVEIQRWWQAERSASPTLFHDELAGAIGRMSWMPGTGARFRSRAVPAVRRILLPGCRYHVYYTVHPKRSEVLVRAVWHAARGRGPDLR